MLAHICFVSLYTSIGISRFGGIFLLFGGFMSKKKPNRTHNKKVYQYDAKAARGEYAYYGIHKDGQRLKIDFKRMKKICLQEGPSELVEIAKKASQIPRNTTYFVPAKKKRTDYIVNEFRDKINALREQWWELKGAFQHIKSPEKISDEYRLDAIAKTSCADDMEDIDVEAMMAGMRRIAPYQKLEVSVCAQFIQQMATELDAIMLRKCRYLGFNPSKEEQISRPQMHTYLHGYVHGAWNVEDVPNYQDVYRKFFTVWNLLKHNSENLFDKVKSNYPDMLLTETYRNGEMSMYYLKIGNDYIEKMLDDLKAFYEDLCERFFGEDKEKSRWNYDDYFIAVIDEWNQSDNWTQY